jgi:hypothetical protein
METQLSASKSHKRDNDDQNQTNELLTVSRTIHQTHCRHDRETTTKAQQKLEKIQTFDLVLQEQDRNKWWSPAAKKMNRVEKIFHWRFATKDRWEGNQTSAEWSGDRRRAPKRTTRGTKNNSRPKPGMVTGEQKANRIEQKNRGGGNQLLAGQSAVKNHRLLAKQRKHWRLVLSGRWTGGDAGRLPELETRRKSLWQRRATRAQTKVDQENLPAPMAPWAGKRALGLAD